MGAAGVPLVPGYHGKEQDIDLMKSEADKIGYPILIKPTHGGGGKVYDPLAYLLIYNDNCDICSNIVNGASVMDMLLLSTYTKI
jgi:hypothetical protein